MSSPDAPVLVTTRESASVPSSLPVMVSVPPLLFTSAAVVPPAVRVCCRRASDAAERARTTPEIESDPPGSMDANGWSESTITVACLPPIMKELSIMEMFRLPISMGREELKNWSGSSSSTCTVWSAPGPNTSDRSSPACRAMLPGCRGGRAGGLPGGANGVVCGGDDGGDTVSPPPHAQHICNELKPGMSKMPHWYGFIAYSSQPSE